MRSAFSSPHVRRLSVAIAPIAAAAALAACGSSSSSGPASSSASSSGGSASSASVSQARALVTKEQAPQKWVQPGPPFAASKVKGKSVWYISVSLEIPFQQNILHGVQQAMAATGNSVVPFDGKGNITTYASGIQQAVSRKASAIIIAGISSKQVSAPLQAAAAAGIPVITEQTHDIGPPLPGEPSSVKANATHCFSCAGRDMADYFVADSNGSGNGLIIWSSDLSFIGDPQLNGLKGEARKLCPKCQLQVRDVRTADWATQIAGTVQSALTADPSIKYVLPLYDGMAPYAVAGVHQANAEGRVKIITFNATPGVMQYIKRHDVVVADLGSAALWQGWGVADQVLRVLAGVKPVDDIYVPERMFDVTNINSIDLSAQESSWYGDPNWHSDYLKLWGLG